ncbi:hypothetical protein PF003_g7997 [Phytophthora fragariae]|nr:hypothetical protein PF003_g7997 [Phytophthora fragariae]
MGLAVALGPHRLSGSLAGTIGQVLPILRLKQIRRYSLVDTGVGDALGVATGGSSRRDMDASKARARATATTFFGNIGLPGWRTRWVSVIRGGDRSTSPASWSTSGFDSS